MSLSAPRRKDVEVGMVLYMFKCSDCRGVFSTRGFRERLYCPYCGEPGEPTPGRWLAVESEMEGDDEEEESKSDGG